MSRTKKTQITAYIGYLVILSLSFVNHGRVGLYDGCTLLERMFYPFIHQNIFHAAINLMVLHQCRRCMPCGWHILLFYLIAVSYPFAGSTHIVGLSGVVYAYMGYIAPHVQKKVKFNLTILFYIAIGFVLPNMAIGVHLYCYILGLLWGYFNAPLCQDR